tara:strand:+ start:1348 stop:1536 length:189 start_codon:yes stop_codon:yes gene_type:complete
MNTELLEEKKMLLTRITNAENKANKEIERADKALEKEDKALEELCRSKLALKQFERKHGGDV